MVRNQKIVDNRRVVGSKKGSGRILVSALLLLAIFAIAASNMAVKDVSAVSSPSLGAAGSFVVLAGSAITNVPTSVIVGDVGLSPTAGTFIGLTAAQVTGTIYAVDASGPAGLAGDNPGFVNTAKEDLTTAYLDAAGRTPTTTFVAGDNQLGGQHLIPGVYAFGHATTANLIGTLTLDAQGDPTAVFIFQASSDLVTASNSVVLLLNGASACNVFWQVTSSATLGTGSSFVGTIMALTSITVNTGATLNGRALARNAAVTLAQNTVSLVCAIVTVTTTTTVIGGTTYTVTYTLFDGGPPAPPPAIIPEYPWGVLLLLIPMLLVYMVLKRRNRGH